MNNYVLVVDLRFNMGLLCIMTFKTYKFYIYVKVKNNSNSRSLNKTNQI
jgi:hypothetical protein